jgi:hypothetical protein
MMSCFSLGFIEHILIWLVVVVAVLAIIRVLLSFATPPAEFQWLISVTTQIVKIVLWAAIIIAVIVLVFGLLSCVVPLR